MESGNQNWKSTQLCGIPQGEFCQESLDSWQQRDVQIDENDLEEIAQAKAEGCDSDSECSDDLEEVVFSRNKKQKISPRQKTLQQSRPGQTPMPRSPCNSSSSEPGENSSEYPARSDKSHLSDESSSRSVIDTTKISTKQSQRNRSLNEALSQRETRGPAFPLMKGNRFRDQILAMIHSKSCQRSSEGARQLRYAILGEGVQCEHCLKYQAPSDYAKEHKQKCLAKMLSYRISFAMINNLYFCYFGCGTYQTRSQLTDHLLNRHEELLPLFGICGKRLAGQRFHASKSWQRTTIGPQNQLSKINAAQDPGDGGTQNQSHLEASENLQLTKKELGLTRMDNVIIDSILKLAEDGSTDSKFTEVKDQTLLRHNRRMNIVFNLDWLQTQVLVAFSLFTGIEKQQRMAKEYPELGFKEAKICIHGKKAVSVQHDVDARTPIMLFKQNYYHKARYIFILALKYLSTLHQRYNIFQGGVSLHTIGLQSNGRVYFFEWAYSTHIDDFDKRVQSELLSYWRQKDLSNKDQLFALDILALMFSFAELVSIMNHQLSPYTILQWWQSLKKKKEFVPVRDGIKFSCSKRLNQLLHQYSKIEEIDYDTISKDFECFLGDGYYFNDDPFLSEWKDLQTKSIHDTYRAVCRDDSEKDFMTLSESEV